MQKQLKMSTTINCYLCFYHFNNATWFVKKAFDGAQLHVDPCQCFRAIIHITMGYCAAYAGKVCSSISTCVPHIQNHCSKQVVTESALFDTITHWTATVLLQASKELPAVKKMLQQAEAVLGYDLLQLCLEGPKEKLDDTVYSQPALFVAGLAAVERLRQDNAQAVKNCSATAGKLCCKACMTGLSAAAC